MRSVDRVIWSEGMFIAPQHLQQSDLYHEMLLEHRISSVFPHSWGITRISWDPSALPQGQLRLDVLEATLPGGEPILVAGDSMDFLAPRELRSDEVGSECVSVFVGYPRASSGPSRRGPRHVQVEREVPDVWGGSDRVRVPLARRAPQIILGEEKADYECVQVAEIFRDSLGVLRISDDYVPPILRLDASLALRSCLGRLLQRLLARRAEVLSGLTNSSGAHIDRAEFERRVMMSALTSAFTCISAVTSSLETHPHLVYLELCRAVGHLNVLSQPGEALEPPPRYVPDDLRGTFNTLISQVEARVSTDIQALFVRVPFQRDVAGSLVASLQPGQIDRCDAAYLIVRGFKERRMILRELPRQLKMASPPMLEKIRAGAIAGVTVEACQQPPAELPIREGMLCFQVDTHSLLWRRAITEEHVALWLPQAEAFEGALFEIWGVLPRPGGRP